MFPFLSRWLSDRVEESLKQAISPLAPYLKHLMVGVFFVLAAAYIAALCVAMFGVSFFMFIGHLPYGSAAAWTGLAFLILALLCGGIGLGFIRKPR